MRTGAREPPDSPDPAPRGIRASTLTRGGGHASGGENTTSTFRSSEMWWNLWGTPAGT